MKKNDALAWLSLLSLILVLVHLPDDYVQGFDKGVVNNSYAIAIFVVWGCGVFVLRERLIGRVILLLGGIIALAMPLMHLNGHFSPNFATSDGAYRFVFTLYAVGTTGGLTIILALLELFGRRSSGVAGVREPTHDGRA